MSRETVACTASSPSSRSARRRRSASRAGRSPTSRRIAPCRSNLFTRAPPRVGRGRGRAPRSETVSGGVSRRTLSPAVPTRDPAARQPATTGPPDGRARRPAAGRGRGPRRPPEAPRARPRAARPSRARTRAARLVDRLDDRAGGRARDGVAAEGAGVVARHEPFGRAVGDEQRADRETVCEPLREHERVGRDAELLPGEEAAGAADARLHLVEASAARRARRRARAPRRGTRASPGGSRPRPERARSGSRPSPGRRARRATRRRSGARSARPARAAPRLRAWPAGR